MALGRRVMAMREQVNGGSSGRRSGGPTGAAPLDAPCPFSSTSAHSNTRNFGRGHGLSAWEL